MDNTAPIFTSDATATAINENSDAGQTVYTAAADDANTTITYGLSGTDSDFFNINTSTGAVTLKDTADSETKSSYAFNVTATDVAGNVATSQVITLAITDVNDNAPMVTAEQSASHDENIAAGTAVHTIAVTDADKTVGVNPSNKFSITNVKSTPFVEGTVVDSNGLFAIDEDTGVITLAEGQSLDFETAKSHNLTVQVSDTDGNSSTGIVTINVDSIDEDPIFNKDMPKDFTYNVTLSGSNNTVIHTFTAVDPENFSTIYGLDSVKVNGADVIDIPFIIDTNTAELSIISSKVSVGEVYTLNITVHDGRGVYIPHPITITIIDNEKPIFNNYKDAESSVSVKENFLSEPFDFSAYDPDVNNQAITKYSLSGTDKDIFSISSEGILSFVEGTLLDYETQKSHTVTISATDIHNETSSHTLTVNLINVTPDRPTTFAFEEDTNKPDDNYTSNGKIKVVPFEAADTWQYSTDGGTTYNETVFTGSGDFALPEGTYNKSDFKVKVTSGTDSLETTVFGMVTPTTKIIIDQTANAPMELKLAATDDTGHNTTDGITNKTENLNITGKADIGATIELFNDGISLGTTIADITTGIFTFTATFAEGSTNNITAKSTDLAGNISGASEQITIITDTVKPIVHSLSLANDNGKSANDFITNDGKPLIDSLEMGAKAFISLDAGKIFTEIDPESYTLAAGIYPANTIHAHLIDDAGNKSVTVINANDFTIDKTPADVPSAIALPTEFVDDTLKYADKIKGITLPVTLMSADTDAVDVTVSWGSITETVTIPAGTISADVQFSGQKIPTGESEIIYSYRDIVGNISTLSQNVIVKALQTTTVVSDSKESTVVVNIVENAISLLLKSSTIIDDKQAAENFTLASAIDLISQRQGAFPNIIDGDDASQIATEVDAITADTQISRTVTEVEKTTAPIQGLRTANINLDNTVQQLTEQNDTFNADRDDALSNLLQTLFDGDKPNTLDTEQIELLQSADFASLSLSEQQALLALSNSENPPNSAFSAQLFDAQQSTLLTAAAL